MVPRRPRTSLCRLDARPPYHLYRIEIGKPDSGRPIWDEWVSGDTTDIAISPDGRTLVFTRLEPETGLDIYTRPLDGRAPARPLRATHADEESASFSPNGRWIAYQSDETGRPEIYAAPLAASESVLISSGGGTRPVWAQSGEIFYRAGEEIYVVRTRPGERFEFKAPRLLFRSRIVSTPITDLRTFDVSPDGSRILAVTIPEESRPRQIDLLLEWKATLPRENR